MNKKKKTKNKKEKNDEEAIITKKREFYIGLTSATMRGILGIFFLSTAVFLLLAVFGKAGYAGTVAYNFFNYLLGIGYYLLPAVSIVIALSLFSFDEHSLVKTKLAGALILFFASLSTVDITFDGGGMVGNVISAPLIKFFDFYASLVFLFALIFVSTLVLFDAKISNILRASLALITRDKSAGAITLTGDESRDTQNNDYDYPDDDEARKNEQQSTNGASDTVTNTLNTSKTDDNKVSRFANMLDFGSKNKKTVTNINDVLDDEAQIKTTSGVAQHSISGNYLAPPISILKKDRGKLEAGDVKENANIIKRTLSNFGIVVEVEEVVIGPSITRYSLRPAEGVKVSRIVGLSQDLSLALAAQSIRMEAPVPGKSLVGIEIPNKSKTTVGIATLLTSPEYTHSDNPLLITLGKSITGRAQFANLTKCPHLLIAGATGSGKSVTIHSLIVSLLYRNGPDNLRFIMIDPKRVELTLYNGIPHLLTPVITEAKRTIRALKWASTEMDRRYDVFEEQKVRDIESYHKNIYEPAIKKETARKKNQEKRENEAKKEEDKKKQPTENSNLKKGTPIEVDSVTQEQPTEKLPERLPYIVIIIDELADIMQAFPRELESAIVRLAQMSRAVGIHLILSTQRPSVNIITGVIKANIPSRIALHVMSQIDSRTILDSGGAEKLLGSGDMLYLSGEMSKPKRLQSAFITENEVKDVVKYLKNNNLPDFVTTLNIEDTNQIKKDEVYDAIMSEDNDMTDDEDELYEKAREIVLTEKKASTSYLQRRLRVGYARAARLIDALENNNVIGPQDGAKARTIFDVDGNKDEAQIADGANEFERDDVLG